MYPPGILGKKPEKRKKEKHLTWENRQEDTKRIAKSRSYSCTVISGSLVSILKNPLIKLDYRIDKGKKQQINMQKMTKPEVSFAKHKWKKQTKS